MNRLAAKVEFKDEEQIAKLSKERKLRRDTPEIFGFFEYSRCVFDLTFCNFKQTCIFFLYFGVLSPNPPFFRAI